MTTSLKDIKNQFDSKETDNKSRKVSDILRSIANTAIADKSALELALADCTALNLDPEILNNFNSNCLAEAFESNKTIRYFNLSRAYPTPNIPESVIKALAKNKTIAYLDLSYNHMSLNTAAELIKNKTLTYLDFSYNYSDNNQVSPLIEALKTNTTLKVLKLKTTINQVDDATQLVKIALTENSSLIELDLIGAYGYKACHKELIDLIKEVFSVKRDIRPPLSVLVDLPKPNLDVRLTGKNQLVYQACLLYAKQAQLAHAAGITLKSHLTNDPASIVAEYLGGAEGEYFIEGIKNQPAPLCSNPQLKAHAVGMALRPHLNDDVANLVADYLGFEDEYFRSGLHNQPAPICPAPILPEYHHHRKDKKVRMFIHFIAIIFYGAFGVLCTVIALAVAVNATLPLVLLCLTLGAGIMSISAYLSLELAKEFVSLDLGKKMLILIGGSLAGVGILAILAAVSIGMVGVLELIGLVSLALIGIECIIASVWLFSEVAKFVTAEKQAVTSSISAVTDALSPPPATINPVIAPSPTPFVPAPPQSQSNIVHQTANKLKNYLLGKLR